MESTVWECQQAPDELLTWIHGRMAGAKHVESISRSRPDTLEVVSAATPGWAIILAVLLFPIGLLFLLAKDRRTLRLWAEPAGSGTRLHIDGGTTSGTRAALIEVWNALQASAGVAASA